MQWQWCWPVCCIDTLSPSLFALSWPDATSKQSIVENWRLGPICFCEHFITNPSHYMPQEAEAEASKRCVVEADLAAAGQRCAEWEHKCAQLEKRLEVCLRMEREGVLVGGSEVWWCWRAAFDECHSRLAGMYFQSRGWVYQEGIEAQNGDRMALGAMVRKAWAWKQGGCYPLLASVSHGITYEHLWCHCSLCIVPKIVIRNMNASRRNQEKGCNGMLCHWVYAAWLDQSSDNNDGSKMFFLKGLQDRSKRNVMGPRSWIWWSGF